MERLQKALQKARQDRENNAPFTAHTATRGAATDRSSGTRFPPAWSRIKPLELDNKFLLSRSVMTLDAQPESNYFDVLRTKILLLMRKNGWVRLGITSPDSGCGKSTISCNLAVGFSRQKEMKSMLLDLDLRSPSVAKILGQQPEHDINELLTGKVTAEEQMLRLRDNVAISMAKRPMKDPTQLLLSRKTGECLDSVQAEFEPDIMIFDLLPMLVSDDTRAILKNVDCALIVARAGQTRVAQVDLCEREVAEHTNVLGVVLNGCSHMLEEEDNYGDYA